MNAVDTNVLIYACDQRDPAFQDKAQNILRSTPDLVILWQVACEFISASRKLAEQGFSQPRAWEYLTDLLKLFPLVLPNREVLNHARELSLKRQMAHWDTLIIAACIQSGVKRLYSEDLPSQDIDGLDIINPFQ